MLLDFVLSPSSLLNTFPSVTTFLILLPISHSYFLSHSLAYCCVNLVTTTKLLKVEKLILVGGRIIAPRHCVLWYQAFSNKYVLAILAMGLPTKCEKSATHGLAVCRIPQRDPV